jgi:AcrR family transcriptional regulator
VKTLFSGTGPACTDLGLRGAHDYDLADYGLTPGVWTSGLRGTYASMTQAHDPTTPRQVYMSHRSRRRRNKLAPDPDVRCAILDAASKSLRDQGVRGLSIAAVLDHAQLSTRAFYRHFESKDELVAAVFVEMARVEMLKVRTKMAKAATPVEAVAAWIDGRLDVALDENNKSDLRHLSLEAQSQMSASPELISPAYAAMLEPLIEQLERGLEHGAFQDIVPATAADSIHGAVWAGTARQRATGDCEHSDAREPALRFCLRGLGVAPETIAEIAARKAS